MEIIVIKIVLAITFGLAFLGKMTGKTKFVFEQAGYATGVMYATGFTELMLTVLLFTKYELFATIGLLGIMGGALFTLIRLKEKPTHYILPVVTVILLLILMWLHASLSEIIQT
jgi:hypothetical protein